MSARMIWTLLCACALTLAGQAPPAAPYVPDLTRWRLELSSPPGGWLTEPKQDVSFKLVDPGDPHPPADAPERTDAYADAESYQPPAPEERTPEQLKAEAQREEAERLANLWRHRTVLVWLNGEAIPQGSIDVNTTQTFQVVSQNGENRLELLEPDSGTRATRSWWVSTTRERLRVFATRASRGDAYWMPGELQVLEPDGATTRYGRTPSGGKAGSWNYTHATPPPGTYTVRWEPSSWQPIVQITVEVVLDGGTDQERRWRFNRLILPGTPAILLGTFDVDP